MVIIASLSDHSDQVSFLLPISARIICTFATKELSNLYSASKISSSMPTHSSMDNESL